MTNMDIIDVILFLVPFVYYNGINIEKVEKLLEGFNMFAYS